jgi:DNA-binding PucR family transcriptional regulator
MFADSVLTAGIGGNCRSAEEIVGSYDDARRTVEILARMGRAGVAATIDDLGIHRLLLQVADLAQLRTFARDVFGELLTSAKGHGREYLPTLACYFRANNSPQRASADLHVHPNTVTYRVRRVEGLTGLDFRSYRDRLMAQVALEILDVVGDAL